MVYDLLQNTWAPFLRKERTISFSLIYHLLLSLLGASIGCINAEQGKSHQNFENTFKKAKEQIRLGNHQRAEMLVDSIRSQIAPYGIGNLANYYILKIESISEQKQRNLYADSLMGLFDDVKNQERYKNLYFEALMMRGQEYFNSRQYGNALLSYYRGKNLLGTETSICNYRMYYSKIAQVYYVQKKYQKAAQNFVQSYKSISNCHSIADQQATFYYSQGDLNNAGFSYEKAGMLDSALHYYTMNLALIDREDKKGMINKGNIANSVIVAYDNLGGLYLKKKNYAAAEKYLKKSLSIPDSESQPGIKNTAYIKLADLYSRLGKTKEADSLLEEGYDGILKNHAYSSSMIYWLKVKADNYYHKNDIENTYKSLTNYINHRDSVAKSYEQLSEIDIDREFQALQQANDLLKFKQENDLNRAFLFAALMFIFMMSLIVILIGYNWKQQRHKNKVINKQNQELQLVLNHLETANRNFIRILQVMAHDLKNPLTGITRLISVLLYDPNRFSQDNIKLLSLIKETSNNTVNVINELLDAGLNDDFVELHKEEVEINALLTQCIDLLRFKAEAKNQKIELSRTKDNLYLLIDKEKIWRLFNNLIVNAIKFSPNDTKIKINVVERKTDTLISIIDNGIGISSQDKDFIFDMFTSVKKFGTAGEKTYGLGLSISKKIIEQHQGKIWFEDNPKGGSMFFVSIPLDVR